jgi:hypothetical protein
MSTAPQPVRVSLMTGLDQGVPWTKVWLNGVDVTRHVRHLTAEVGVGALADVWLDLVGVTLDAQADVPPDRVQALTSAQDQANQEARLTVDQQRGQRQYGRKGITPGVQLAVSLGQRPRQEGT